MKHLLLLSIGPVQSFISQARKTHDLYAGSRLLSDLVQKAISTIGEDHLIFPKKGDAAPNRFLAEVPSVETDMQTFGERIENEIRIEWKRIADDALGNIPKPPGFDEQIAGLLEIFWVVEPINEGDEYKSAVARLEKSLAAVKNVRRFSQYSWQEGIVGERGRKCSLDGQRNVLFYRKKGGENVSETKSPLYATDGSVYISEELSRSGLQPGEGLSAVSFVKRSYRRKGTKFESTADIALMDALNFLESVDDTEIKVKFSCYRHSFRGDAFNSQLYYEEGLEESFLEKQGIIPTKRTDDIRANRKDFAEYTKKYGRKFQKYYAILTFDGDDMGKWLSGENLDDQKRLREFQKAFAACLGAFAEAAKQRLDEKSGQTVYAGGDDFLGFVNLNHLLPVLLDLRRLFLEKVDKPLTGFKSKEIAFSAGICVAHYKEPLSLVLQEAKNAQKKAKDLDKEKNSFAISVIKGSGESHTAALPFGENEANLERVQYLVNALVRQDFSNSFIKTMRKEFERLGDFKSQFALREIFQTELLRLLQRAAKKSSDKMLSEKLHQSLVKLFGSQKVENFFQLLHIVDFFQRELDFPKELLTTSTQTN